jgi:Xanthosine triphosphate pyrophosphatase
MKILLATTNKGKLAEFQSFLKGYEILSLSDVNFTTDIIEDGSTYLENARIKAKTLSELYPEYYVLGDDSGAEFEVFGEEKHFPGLFSHRWKGDLSNSERNQYILSEIKKVNNIRRASGAVYFCALSLFNNGKEIFHNVSNWKGSVLSEEQIGRGFGYDSIFTVDYKTSVDVMDINEKNMISHRGQALFNLEQFLNEINNVTSKTVSAVSLFNNNRYTLADIPENELEKSVVVLFCVDNEFYNQQQEIQPLLDKSKGYYRVPIEDIELDNPEEEEKYRKEIEEQVGPFEFPNKKRLKKVLNFIKGQNNVIVACSAGIARSGAFVLYLKENGYKLNPNYNTRFGPNKNILDILNEL